MKINSHILSGIIIILLGVIVLISEYFINYNYHRSLPNLIKTECTIEEIDLDKYTTAVSYKTKDETITKRLKLYDSSFRVGSKTDIYYDSNEPINSYLQCEVTLFKMMMSVGIIIIVTGLYFIVIYFVKKKHYKILKESGKKIKADITSIDGKKFISFLPYHPSTICASAKIDGNNYNFISDTIYSNSIKYIKDKKIKKINVYIDKNEMGDYFVDTSFIASKM